jgi:hypothetical protein
MSETPNQGLSRGWITSDGCGTSRFWAGSYAFTTTALERQQSEKTFCLQAKRRFVCPRPLTKA